MKSILTIAAAFAVAHHASAAFFADQVVSFTPGTGQDKYLNPQTALGEPSAFIVDEWGSSNFSIFNPHYLQSELAQVLSGGSLTLRLSQFVVKLPGAPEIGVFGNAFFASGGGNILGAASPGSAWVEVSEDGQTWYSLSADEPIVFDMPGTYFLNSGPYDPAPPVNPEYADFGKPFTGSAASFTGMAYSDAVAALGGSAGGTWLDIDDVPLSQVGFIRFTVTGTDRLLLDAVSVNTAAAGGAVPEPSTAAALAGGAALLGLIRRRRS